MKLLTKNTDYAVRALIYLIMNSGRYVSSREISRKDRIPLPYLRRILQKLREKRLISTREGATGGVRINSRSVSMRITDLIRMFQGEIELADCLFRKEPCAHRKNCPLRKRLKEIEKKVITELSEITIGDLHKDFRGRNEKKDHPD